MNVVTEWYTSSKHTLNGAPLDGVGCRGLLAPGSLGRVLAQVVLGVLHGHGLPHFRGLLHLAHERGLARTDSGGLACVLPRRGKQEIIGPSS